MARRRDRRVQRGARPRQQQRRLPGPALLGQEQERLRLFPGHQQIGRLDQGHLRVAGHPVRRYQEPGAGEHRQGDHRRQCRLHDGFLGPLVGRVCGDGRYVHALNGS